MKLGRNLVRQTFRNCEIDILTQDVPECIGHIAVSKGFAGERLAVAEGNKDKSLSDHKGIVVEMKATIRSLSEKALDRAIGRVKAIVEKTAQAYECRSEILWNVRIPAVYNTPEMTLLARQCAGLTDCEVTDTAPSLASEDFALYRAHVPSFFYWVGSTAKEESRAEELHRPCFHTDDHALAGAAELLAVSAIRTVRWGERLRGNG